MGNSGVKLNRCFSLDALMWPEFVIPHEIKTELIAHVRLPQRDDDLTRAFGFHGTDKTLDNGNGAIFADCAIARSDILSFAPLFESMAPELTAFVGDDVFRGLAGSVNGTAEEGTDLQGIGLVVEDGEANDLS